LPPAPLPPLPVRVIVPAPLASTTLPLEIRMPTALSVPASPVPRTLIDPAPESSCASDGQVLLNYNWGGAYSLPASTAAGAFQVLLKRNSNCYENPACYKAINDAYGTTYGSSEHLNCASGFGTNGIQLPGSAIVGTCVMAAANLNCSASAAACLLQGRGGSFEDWRKDSNSARQTQCINSGGAIGGG